MEVMSAVTVVESTPPERNTPSGTSLTSSRRTLSVTRSRKAVTHSPSDHVSPSSGTSQ